MGNSNSGFACYQCGIKYDAATLELHLQYRCKERKVLNPEITKAEDRGLCVCWYSYCCVCLPNNRRYIKRRTDCCIHCPGYFTEAERFLAGAVKIRENKFGEKLYKNGSRYIKYFPKPLKGVPEHEDPFFVDWRYQVRTNPELLDHFTYFFKPRLLLMPEGMHILDAIKQKKQLLPPFIPENKSFEPSVNLTKEKAIEETRRLQERALSRKEAHCDIKYENIMWFPTQDKNTGRMYLIDNGTWTEYGMTRKVKTSGVNSSYPSTNGTVSEATDAKGWEQVRKAILDG